MMRKKNVASIAAAAAMIVSVLAGTAAGGINTDKPIGDLYLDIGEGGETWIVNGGTAPCAFDGYTIASYSGALDPYGWIPLGEPRPDPWIPWLPLAIWPEPWPGLIDWSVLSRTPFNLTEATLTSPGICIQAGEMVPIGAPAPGGTQEDLTFTYADSSTCGSWEGRVIPEPVSAALMALGGLGLLRTGRRRR